jgi:hypothetical protein
MTTRTADVVILHAKDLAAGPVATIHIPAPGGDRLPRQLDPGF